MLERVDGAAVWLAYLKYIVDKQKISEYTLVVLSIYHVRGISLPLR